MPYCPKCDMEFVDGFTVCSDCGGPLVESEEAAMEMKRKEQELEMERRAREMEALAASYEENDPEASDSEETAEMRKRTGTRPHVYKDLNQRYEDLNSSAWAFYIVGGILTCAGVLAFVGIINIPAGGLSKLMFQGALLVMGIGSLIIAVKSSSSAKAMVSSISEERDRTQQIIENFKAAHTGESLDSQILSEDGEMSPEELSLKRFSLIQDILITENDLPDQDYIDALCEEIYNVVFPE